jgi:hypothetical protein
MNNTVMVVSVLLGLGFVGCGGATSGGNGKRGIYNYKAVTTTGTLTLNSQLAGGCTATSAQSLALGLGTTSTVSYTPSTGSFGGRLEVAYTKQDATGSNSCGAFYCNHPTGSAKVTSYVALTAELPDDPPANTMVTPVIKDLNSEQLGDCGAELFLPAALEAEQVTVGTFTTPEFTLTGSGQKNLMHNDLQGTATGTLDYTFSIKFQLQPE